MKKYVRDLQGNEISYGEKKHLKIMPHVWIYLALLFVLVPLYIMIITSFMSDLESQDSAFHWWPKLGFTTEWYAKAFTLKLGQITFFKAFANTILMYLPSTMVGVLVASMSAYAFAKINFKGSKQLYTFLITAMMLPSSLNTVVQYLIYDTIGWVNTVFPIMVPRMLGSITVVFFLTQYYKCIPNDLVGAAKVDGLSDFGVFVKIMLPIGIPAMIGQFILQFIIGYNDYIGPLLYLTEDSMYTMSLLLARFGDNAYAPQWSLKMTGCVIGMVPLVILYFISQNFIMKGMSITSGLKG